MSLQNEKGENNMLTKETMESLEPTPSVTEAQLVELHENRNGQFHRSFTPRQVHVRSGLSIPYLHIS